MLLADMTGWDFLSTNWVSIVATIGAAMAALGTALGAAARAIWVYCVIPVANYATAKVDNLERINTEQIQKIGAAIETMSKTSSSLDQRVANVEEKLDNVKCNYKGQ